MTESTSRVTRSPYEALLGDAFDALHPNVRTAHRAPLRATGVLDVVHGSHYLAPLLVTLMTLPDRGTSVPVDLHVVSGPAMRTASSLSMLWMRRIGRSTLNTRQFARGGVLVEESRLGSAVFQLRTSGGSLIYEHASIRFLRLPLPGRAAPRTRACVSPHEHGWHVEVVVEWRGHLICRYSGSMRPVQTPS